MPVLKMRICLGCGEQYRPTTNAQKYCGNQKERGSCSWLRDKELSKKWAKDNPDRIKGYRKKWRTCLIDDPARNQKYIEDARLRGIKRRETKNNSPGKAKQNEDYWRSHPDKLDYLIRWYPHWGATPLVNDLNIPINVIRAKARQLNIKVLTFKEERLCYYCRVGHLVASRKGLGRRCTECFKPYRADKKQSAMLLDPLKERLRELAHGINSRRSRNPRKGSSTKITMEDLLKIWNRQGGICPYSGRRMTVSNKRHIKRGPDTLSVDRIDSRKGYSIDNIVLCTWWANIAKYDLETSAFIERCREVAQWADSIKQGV